MSNQPRMPGPVAGSAESVGEPMAAPVEPDANNALLGRKPGRIDEEAVRINDETVIERSDDILERSLQGNRLWGKAFVLFVVNLAAWLFYSIWTTLVIMVKQYPVAGSLLLVLAGMFVVVLFLALRREYYALRAVDRLEERDRKIRSALKSGNLTLLKDALEQTFVNLRKRHSGLMRTFEEAAKYRDSAADYFRQFDNLVLTKLDEEADATIRASLATVGLATAISPNPVLDAVISLWRSVSLSRKIGQIYGLEPTGLSSLRLLKYSVMSSLLTGSTAIVAARIINAAAPDSLSIFGVKLAQAAIEVSVAVARLYRLGQITKIVCRPPAM